MLRFLKVAQSDSKGLQNQRTYQILTSQHLLLQSPLRSKEKEAVTSSISENVVVPHEATQGQLPSDGSGNPSTVLDVISRKSKLRRSYTSLLMAGSKVEAYSLYFTNVFTIFL